MRILSVHIIEADTCGGLLDGLSVKFRGEHETHTVFDPLCLIGPNGTGKSQLLQIIAEIFQTVFHALVKTQERIEGNAHLQFEIEYLITTEASNSYTHVRVSRKSERKRKAILVIQSKDAGGKWIDYELNNPIVLQLLPHLVIGYTSGGNETLSIPFLLSRSGYAEEVGSRAINNPDARGEVPDTKLMLIDYGTHLEVLVANLLLANDDQRTELLSVAKVKQLHSFRCIVQLAHSAAPKAAAKFREKSGRKGIQLTAELEGYLQHLRSCATCHSYNEKTETYVFDYLINEATIKAFKKFWDGPLHLYSALHKLSMLNDLAIPKVTRNRFKKQTRERHFASRLPEPQDEHKVFRFEQVSFASNEGGKIVDYVSLSDGEHQMTQLLGTFLMISFPRVLFLLDEPESHFNPKWRVLFVSKLLNLPTQNGTRRENSLVARQDALLTTHAPFVPSDMHREKVFIFRKDETGISVENPNIETFGAAFDAILEQCFEVSPPISAEPRRKIEELSRSNNAEEIKEGMQQLGPSVQKALLADRVRQVSK